MMNNQNWQPPFSCPDVRSRWETQPNDPGRDLAGRIMTAEYNLDVQRGDYPQAGRTLAQLFGYWFTRR